MGNRPIVLRVQRELVDEHKDLLHTTAGEAINRELNAQMKRHQVELEEVREGMRQAMREKDEETAQELEAERRRLQERMGEIARDAEGMDSEYAEEKERVELRLGNLEQGARVGGRRPSTRRTPPRLSDEPNMSPGRMGVEPERLPNRPARRDPRVDSPPNLPVRPVSQGGGLPNRPMRPSTQQERPQDSFDPRDNGNLVTIPIYL